jgi:hypothetical protein
MPPRNAQQRGDFTGQQRTKLTEEKAKELTDRQKEIGLVNQVDIVVEEEGIFDPITGELTELPEGAQAKVDQLKDQPITVEDDDPILDPTTQPAGYDPMKDLRDLETKQQPRPVPANALEIQDLGAEPITVDDEWRVIRVNADVEDMTYGAGNSYTFLRGRRYRVPKGLYEWLESRELVYH